MARVNSLIKQRSQSCANRLNELAFFVIVYRLGTCRMCAQKGAGSRMQRELQRERDRQTERPTDRWIDRQVERGRKIQRGGKGEKERDTERTRVGGDRSGRGRGRG